MKLSPNYLALIVILSSSFASAQVSTGTPPFGSFGGGPFDTVNLGNLNVHFAIPVLHKAGRGMPFTYDLSYDSSIWTPVTANGVTQWQPAPNWGWRGATEAQTGYISYSTSSTVNGACTTYIYSNYAYHDSFGAQHPFPGHASRIVGIHCTGGLPLTATAADGSGYTLTGAQGPAPAGVLTGGNGKVIAAPLNTTSGAGTMTDANGNQLTVNSSLQFFDTLSGSAQVLTVAGSGTPSSPTTFTYTAPSGGSAIYTMHYEAHTVATGFGVSGITEYGPITNVPLVDYIALPDDAISQDRYTFTYESGPSSCSPCVTGRIKQITLPTGGTITYSYPSGSSGIESDGSTASMTRTLSPGGEWQYSRALQAGSKPVGPGSTWTTTVTDPIGDITVINFAEDSTTTGTNTIATYNMYETQRQVNQLIGGTDLTDLLYQVEC